MSEKAIEVYNLSYSYNDGTRALSDINFQVARGSKVALLGPNGAGKSTLLLHLNGIFLAQTGSVYILGKQVTGQSLDYARGKVGLVFQDPDDQLFALTVRQDVAFGPKNMGLEASEVGSRTEKAMAAVGVLDLAEKAPHNLSYGQKKRVALAGVLAMEPEIILLDEPMAFLDPRSKETAETILNQLNMEGKTILMATHDVDFAVEWADEVIILHGGKVVIQEKPAVLTNEKVVSRYDLTLPTVTKAFWSWCRKHQSAPPQNLVEAKLLLNKTDLKREET